MDDDGDSGSGVGQWWMMTMMTTATVAVDDHGSAPLPPRRPCSPTRCVSLPPGAVGGVWPTPPRLLAIEYCNDGGCTVLL
jgi:hypothetical protein